MSQLQRTPVEAVSVHDNAALPPGPAVPRGPAGTPGRARARPALRSVARRILLTIAHTPSALIGALVVLFWIVCAVFWPLIVPYDPDRPDYNAILSGPTRAHLFGTDQYGRDVLSRVIAGSREVLLTAPAITLLGLLGGITVGLLTAYYRGLFDEIVMRVMDAIIAFPTVVLALLILAVFGSSRLNVIIIIAIAYVPLTGRVVRAAALGVRDLDYVSAARLRGARAGAIMLTEILPNITGPIIVEGTVRIGYAIFATASLSFIGLGIQPPAPDWGAMIYDLYGYLQSDPWIILAPALAIASLVVAINLLADGLHGVTRA